MFIPRKILEERLIQLLTDDIGQGDITTATLVPADLKAEAAVTTKEAGVAAGIEEATILGESLGLSAKPLVADGDEVKKGRVIMTFSGDARTLLSFERTMLNLLSRMSGIATATRRLSKKLEKAHLNTRIAATRKTAPGLLYFDKKAASLGGGDPHRFHLDDMILIKDNHLALSENIETAIKQTKQKASFTKKIEVEVTSIEDALKAAKAGADIIMLDNFSPQRIKETIESLKKLGLLEKILTEASGGITEKNLVEYAQTQVNIISLGELTHSAKALDISMEIKPKK
jgi:nicotinate-nucleotide pyrophosphorylase (carboxylating)